MRYHNRPDPIQKGAARSLMEEAFESFTGLIFYSLRCQYSSHILLNMIESILSLLLVLCVTAVVGTLVMMVIFGD